MVKNVTGYDMAKLYTGSLGTLGVLASAWLRLRPRPASSSEWELSLPASRAAELGVSIARGHGVRGCALVGGSDPESCRLVVELAGDGVTVSEAVRGPHPGARGASRASGITRRPAAATERNRSRASFAFASVPCRAASAKS